MFLQYHVKLLNFSYTSFYGVVAPLLPKIQSYTDTYKRRILLLLFPIEPESRLQVKLLIALGLSVHIKYKLPQTRDGVISKSPAKILPITCIHLSTLFWVQKIKGEDKRLESTSSSSCAAAAAAEKEEYVYQKGKRKVESSTYSFEVLGEKKGLFIDLSVK